MPEIAFAVHPRQADAIARSGVLADPTATAPLLEQALAGRSERPPGPPRPLPDGVDVVPGCIALAALAAGDRLELAQVAGHTCVDVIVLGPGADEALSPEVSRAASGDDPTAGIALSSGPPWSRPLVAIVEDTAPGHDLRFPACSPAEFAVIGCAPEPSCRALHMLAAEAVGRAPDAAPDPLNLWFRSWPEEDGALAWARTPTAPGDAVVLEALADCVVAANPCVSDLFGCSPFGAGALRVAAPAGRSVDLLGTPLPPPDGTLRLALPDGLAARLADHAAAQGASADALARALVLDLAVAALGAPQALGR